MGMRTFRISALAAAFVVVVAACGDDSVDSPITTSPVTTSPVTTSPIGSDSEALAGSSWVAVSISGEDGPRAVITGNEPTIEFGPKGDTISGSTGCNTYSGHAAIGGGTMSLGQIGVTERGCIPREIMDQESLVLRILNGVETFLAADGTLTLQGPQGSISFVEPEPVVDASLGGTPWVLDTLVRGIAATSVLAGTIPGLSVDPAQGTMTGTTGCNGFGGSVEISGSSFTVSELSWTEIGCESGIMDQEAFILEVLSTAESFGIDGDRLTITSSSGDSLVYRAV